MQHKQIVVPGWFRTVAILALLWNLAGVAMFVGYTMIGPDDLARMPETERALFEAVPGWANTAWAVAVFSGVIASLFLLLRWRLAVPLFAVSLAAVLVQGFHSLVLSGARQIHGDSALVLPLVIIAIAIYLLLVSAQGRNNGWLR